MLDRVRVLCGHGDGRGEAVVLLVDVLVEQREDVEEAVHVVEEELAHDQGQDDVARDDWD